MPLNLHQVGYGLQENNELVSRCLQEKIRHVQTVHGIGPKSCCALLELMDSGVPRYVFGKGQIENPIIDGIYQNDYMKCHGEASALMTALERAQVELKDNGGNLAQLITRVYIEMSPCAARCTEMLQNVNPN